MSKRKVENFNNPAIFWQHYETYCLNMAISEKKEKSTKPDDFGATFGLD
jgi:hypothetical protein